MNKKAEAVDLSKQKNKEDLFKNKNILQPDDDETEKDEEVGSNSEVDSSYGKDDLESVHSTVVKIDIF